MAPIQEEYGDDIKHIIVAWTATIPKISGLEKTLSHRSR